MDGLAGGAVEGDKGGLGPVAEAHVAAGGKLEGVEVVDTA